MPNPREPINILLAKGRKHLTQEEIQRRMATEPTAPADDIQPPEYLSKKQREEFSALAEELQRIKIIGNVDAGELARYVVAHGFYARYTKLLRTLPTTKRARLRELRATLAAEAGRARAAGPAHRQAGREVPAPGQKGQQSQRGQACHRAGRPRRHRL